MNQKNNPVSFFAIYNQFKNMILYHDHTFGLFSLFSVLLVLAIFSGIPESKTPVFYVDGEVATTDIIADRDLTFEDIESTEQKRKQIIQLQPLIYDLNPQVSKRVSNNILTLIRSIDQTDKSKEDERINALIYDFNTNYNTAITKEDFLLLIKPNVQEYVKTSLLPWITNCIKKGILPKKHVFDETKTSLLIRNVKDQSETIISIESGHFELEALLSTLKNKINSQSILEPNDKKVLYSILSNLIIPSLTLNSELTDSRMQNILFSVEPIFYNINKGEILVRKGDKVDNIVQLKIQALFDENSNNFNFTKSFGVFLLGLMCMLGLYISPSGVKGRKLKNRDQLFISVILLLVGSCAVVLSHYSTSSLLPYVFPISGVSGLAVLIFAARRYCVLGLLLSFYTTVLFNADVGLFFYYFFSAMFGTWLILRTQSRQDVLWSTFPLLLFQLIVGLSTSLLFDINSEQFEILIILICINSVLSILVLFALSPVLEILFGYTTRFRLMELLSLDHPLLQELMMNVQGTYHHSLIVSNLVEGGAKAVGANSLLVKVAALYHDIGKLARPNYFSENQFDGINPHDKLSPTMSCLILFSHVKTGAELASKHKLGDEIIAMILQHHGTRIPMAFFHKAVNLGENPSEAEYSYPGPKPQTKEAAILMMADTVEAAIRSMRDPSPARIRSSIEMLIKKIYEEGQFDETELTFKDLNKLIDSFTRSLTGVYHQRIAYPEIKKADKEDQNPKSQRPDNVETKFNQTDVAESGKHLDPTLNIFTENNQGSEKEKNDLSKEASKEALEEALEEISKEVFVEISVKDTETTNIQFDKDNPIAKG